MTTITTATYVLDTDAYLAHGGTGAQDTLEWAGTFRELGGRECTVHPSWRFGTEGPIMVVTGTPEAVAFVDATLEV